MKKFYFILLFAGSLSVAAQKNSNGKIYDQHPGIDLVEKFNKAFIAADEAQLNSLMIDDFKAYNGEGMNKDRNSATKQDMINQAKYWNGSLMNYSIDKRGGSYPDALEYKRSGTWVYTYDVFHGIDKNNGFKIEMPYDRSFILNKTGDKIAAMIINYNTRIMDKYNLSFETIRNGTIYKDHENIRTLRKVISYFEMGDHDKAYSFYTKGARFSDINAPIGSSNSIAENREGFEQTLTKYDLISIDEYGYPDLLDYEGSGSETISWWTFRFKSKKTGELIKVFCHFTHSFNAEGQITRQVAYYNGALLP
jgi:hypothetical protein